MPSCILLILLQFVAAITSDEATLRSETLRSDRPWQHQLDSAAIAAVGLRAGGRGTHVKIYNYSVLIVNNLESKIESNITSELKNKSNIKSKIKLNLRYNHAKIELKSRNFE